MEEIIKISAKYVGKRLDVAIAENSTLSRTKIKNLIENGNIIINNSICSPDQVIKQETIVKIKYCTTIPTIEPENIAINIVYEDDDIIIVNKDAGMVCHPAPGNYTGTLVNAILWHCKNLPINNGIMRPGLVHRLDKDTSGLLIIAKNEKSMQILQQYFQNKSEQKIVRKYICICYGSPKNKTDTIETFITRNPKNRQLFATSFDTGKIAITKYNVLRTYYLTSTKILSKIECQLLTGRTHQIRVHMKHLKCPIIGDPLYGKTFNEINRTALHSYYIKLIHPINKKTLEITVNLPNDMQQICDKYNLD